MSASSKVVWSEGLFLQPQHFQQQERYLERYVELRCKWLVADSWGLTDLELEPDLLSIGKFGLRRAVGVFPDGTPMRMPADDPLPEPLDIPTDARDQRLFLAVPVRRAGAPEVARAGSSDVLARHGIREIDAFDATTEVGETATLEVGALRTRYLLEQEVTAAYSCIPLAHLIERRSDQRVIIDDKFIPTVLQHRASARLAAYTKYLVGRLHQRGEELASEVTVTGRGGSAELGALLFLQAINRYEPLMRHVSECGVHPEQLFRFCVSAIGELSTFLTQSKRPASLPPYRHDRLRESFDPVIDELEKLLNTLIEKLAVPIPIEERRFGTSLARVAERELLDTAVFVLGVRADLAAEEIRRRVPTQLKVGPPERIQQIVTRALRGVPVEPMPAPPRHIPVHAGFVYFEFDQAHEYWKEIRTAGSLAFHPGEFPGLSMELWAIRS